MGVNIANDMGNIIGSHGWSSFDHGMGEKFDEIWVLVWVGEIGVGIFSVVVYWILSMIYPFESPLNSLQNIPVIH